MAEFTKEQEEEIQRRVAEMQQYEQYRIAGLTGFKEAVHHLRLAAQAGQFDPYVADVMENEKNRFVNAFFPQEQKPEEKEEDKKDNEESEWIF